MMAVHNACVQGVSKIQKPAERVTLCCGPSLENRPASSSGEPIVNELGGSHRIRWVTRLGSDFTEKSTKIPKRSCPQPEAQRGGCPSASG